MKVHGAVFGSRCLESFAKYDQDTCSWRTFQRCLDGGLDEFTATWPRAAMIANMTAYRRVPLAPLTGGTGSGLWPTMTGADSHGHGYTLDRGDKGKRRLTLVGHARMWPTPTAGDWRQAGKPGQRRGQLNDPAMGVCPTGGQLNPTWVAWLMGYPIGWTDCGVSGTR